MDNIAEVLPDFGGTNDERPIGEIEDIGDSSMGPAAEVATGQPVALAQSPTPSLPGISIPSTEIGSCPWPPPAPFDPGPEERRPYKLGDPQEALIPPASFVSDFVYSMKGKESPIILNIWAALYAVAVESARKVKFKWAIGDLYPNLYLLVVAPPASVHKGAALGRASRILTQMPEYLAGYSRLLSEEKHIKCISSRATSEGIYKALVPKTFIGVLPNGSPHTENYGSRAFVWAPEFATFLNSKKYTEGLVDALTNWYDCLDHDSEDLATRARKPLRDIFFCLAGALTPGHLQKSLPEEAFTGGFMSRVVMICQERPYELFPEPVDYEGYPTEEYLLERLAWIAWTARGSYEFTPEAKVFYYEFYMTSRERTLAATSENQMLARQRHELLVLRVAILLRMAEYREGRDITVENLQWAIKLLEYTYSCQTQAVETVGLTPEAESYVKTRRIILNKGSIKRLDLQRRCAKISIMTHEMNLILQQLHEQGEVAFYIGNKVRNSPSPISDSTEEYRWIGSLEERSNG